MRELWLKRWQPAYAGTQRLELSGGMEVNSPDVAAAIERFTSRVAELSAAARPGVESGSRPALPVGGSEEGTS
jgi:hypothetical protein